MPSFPTSLAEVSSEWVIGMLGAQPATEVTLRVPLSHTGYGSEIGYLDIASDDPALPSSLVVKVPPKDYKTREAVIQFGAFTREVLFYRSIAPRVPIRTPKVYAMELDAESGNGIILLEDCSQMKSFLFDQIPPSLHELLQMASSLARLHAAWWGKTEELPLNINRGCYETWNTWLKNTQSGWRRWLSSPLSAQLDHSKESLGQRLSNEFVNLSNAMPVGNLTFCHMDFHVQNIFYDAVRVEDPIVVIDWDSYGVGCGPHDLAYLMSLLPTQHRKDYESEVLRKYHSQLLTSGVAGYDDDAMYADYRFGTLLATALQPILFDLATLDVEGLQSISRLASRQLQMVFDHDAHYLFDTR